MNVMPEVLSQESPGEVNAHTIVVTFPFVSFTFFLLFKEKRTILSTFKIDNFIHAYIKKNNMKKIKSLSLNKTGSVKDGEISLNHISANAFRSSQYLT